jgi:hypothetical protein
MKVKELIEQLSKFDGDLEVVYFNKKYSNVCMCPRYRISIKNVHKVAVYKSDNLKYKEFIFLKSDD